MTEYYTNKSDFENGKNLGFLENNVQQVVDLLNDISKAATIVQENDLSALYIAQGGATLGKDMPENDFTEAEHKVLKIMDALKDIHREVVQNIENKYISGLEDAMESLNKVNEGKNQYKSDHLTYQEKTTTYINNGMAGQVQTTTTQTKHFTLSDILNSDKSPIPAAAAKYSEKLRVAKERLKELEKSDKETYDKIKDVTERELVETFYPTEMGEYKRLKSTWSKDNEQWLGWVDTGIKVVGTVALIVGTVASGGLLAPASLAIGTTLLGGEAAYRAISGETITGEVLSTEQRLWAGAEAVTTLASGGIGTYMKGANLTERTVSQGLLNADKAARYGANAYDVAQFGHDFNEDPKMALTNLATSQLVGRTIGHLGNKYKAFRASKTGNVDIRSGEATGFKTNLKDRVRTAWTDIKTKTGDVKVQVGEGFDNFKNRVSNVKNRAMASGAEKVSEKLENLNAELGVRKQNFQRNLAAMQGQRELEFQLSGETPGIGVTANYSERLENLTKKIQQFSVEHRQKIQNFEGRGGGRTSNKTPKIQHIDDIPRIEEIKVKFNHNPKHREEEFSRQLADQQNGMNELTVQEYLDNRERYIAEGRALEGNAVQQAARREALSRKYKELRKSGLNRQDATLQAEEWLATQAALHNPDQIAGGYPDKIGGMGDTGVNSSIGIQWRYRIDYVDEQILTIAKTMSPEQLQSTYLNVRLTY